MGKNIVILCDGTGNRIADTERTNIVEMLEHLEQSDEQVVYYDTGVGTASGARAKWLQRGLKLFRKATGNGVRDNVRQAYRFLMDHYEEGDRVYLFGFSRGAYTARLIAGLVKKVGLLKPGNFQLVEPATNLYFDDHPSDEVAAFRRIATRECVIHFVGVFDTVASMAFLYKVDFFTDARLHPSIRHGVHAVSIDERRNKFKPNLWTVDADQEGARIHQVWFAGVHSDVGGSYPERGLAALALRWMLKHARAAGLKVPDAFLTHVDKEADADGKLHDSMKLHWRLLGGADARTLPPGAAVHESVAKRMEALGD